MSISSEISTQFIIDEDPLEYFTKHLKFVLKI